MHPEPWFRVKRLEWSKPRLVELAFTRALEVAAAAGRFDVVAQLARELEARRLAGACNVVILRTSLMVGLLLHSGHERLAFGIPTAFGIGGVVWLILFMRKHRSR